MHILTTIFAQLLLSMKKEVMQQLEKQVDELLVVSRRIRLENQQLHAEKSAWLSERKQLVEKTNLARDQVDKVITRLRELDNQL